MPRQPGNVYRAEADRAAAWEAIDDLTPGQTFTLLDLFEASSACMSTIRRAVHDAVRVGLVERLGRDHSRLHGPYTYRRRT